MVRIRGASCMNVSKSFVESDTYSLLWCVNLPPNWWTRCDEWTNDTFTHIRHIFSYTRCANHDAWHITNTNHASCGPSFREKNMCYSYIIPLYDSKKRSVNLINLISFLLCHPASFFDAQSRVANITDSSVEVWNSENDPYFSRFLHGIFKFLDFLQILQFFDFF